MYVGVVQQNNDGDVDCLYDYCRMIKDEKEIEPKVRRAGSNLFISIPAFIHPYSTKTPPTNQPNGRR